MKTPLLFLTFIASVAVAQQPPSLLSEAARFTTIESIMAVVPSTVSLRTDGKWSVVGVEQANDAVTSNVKGRAATLRLKVEVFQPFKENGWAYRIMAPDGRVSLRGTPIFYRIWAYFRADQADALAKVRKGSTIIVSGVLGRADIQMHGGRPGLSLDLYEAKVERQ